MSLLLVFAQQFGKDSACTIICIRSNGVLRQDRFRENQKWVHHQTRPVNLTRDRTQEIMEILAWAFLGGIVGAVLMDVTEAYAAKVGITSGVNIFGDG